MEERTTARIAGLSLGGIFLAGMMLAAFGVG